LTEDQRHVEFYCWWTDGQART